LSLILFLILVSLIFFKVCQLLKTLLFIGYINLVIVKIFLLNNEASVRSCSLITFLRFLFYRNPCHSLIFDYLSISLEGRMANPGYRGKLWV
jgi:hypothetical protein